jgi:ribosome-binding protein aMBF1 (putative translation factor)
MNTKLSTPEEIKKAFDDLFATITPEEREERDAQLLAFRFLSIIDAEMEKQSISKKELAQRVGTSASFITQLFRGDRKPNWTILAKMQKELGVTFAVSTQYDIEQIIANSISQAHKIWVKDGCYSINESRKLRGHFEVFSNSNDCPLAS